MYGIGIAKGLLLTLRHVFRRPFTVQYPEERAPMAARFRGYRFNWYVEKCTACATCAKACPHGVIRVATSIGDDGSINLNEFTIDTGRCIFCGLCVESCPYEALYMGSGFEHASYLRRDLILTKETLIADPKQPSTYCRPSLEAERAQARLGQGRAL